MTIVAPQMYKNISKRGLTIGGQGLRGALIETGIGIAETVITNYLTNKFSGKTPNEETNTGQGRIQNKRYGAVFNRKRKRTRSFSRFRRRGRRTYNKWRKPNRQRFRYYF